MDKKKLGIIGIVVLVIALIVISSFISPKGDSISVSTDADSIYERAVQESAAVSDEERKPYTEISVNTYLEKYNAPEKSLILLGRETCQYCQIAEPILQKLSKQYDLEILYLNTDTFSDDDITNFLNSDETFSDSFGTPFLFIVENGRIVDKVDGVVDTALYEDFLIANGLI